MRRIPLQQALTPYLTRREILQGAAALGVGLVLDKSGIVFADEKTDLLSLDLGGDMWTMEEEGKSGTIPALMPGSTYTNLLTAKKIPDPFYGENNGKVQWVAEKNWIFERSFEVPGELRSKQHVELACHGLDTLATVWVNDRQVGTADNMFRTWTFDIKPHLRGGTNHIRVRFDTLTPFVEKQRAAYKQQYDIDLPNPRSWVRKAPYMWGWDWCLPVLTQGIWKKIEILGYDARIADLNVVQNHQPDGSVQLEIHTTVAGAAKGSSVKTQVMLAGDVIAEATGPVDQGATVLQASIPKPQLWWPNGMGDQPLYSVTARLTDSKAQSLDTASRRIGLRKVAVLPPSNDVAMHVQVNGVPVFAKGADWIPADNMPTRVTPEILRWYMTKAVECNFNFIRLWGGGYYEEDELFDLCDEMGLMLQFEFKFANASYPVNDSTWISNLQTEIEQQTRRCRNHPSIVIWSGNNEIEYFKGYNHLFKDVIGDIVHRLVPGAFYEVGSGAAGSGDIHTWDVWHGNQPVESYRKVEGFVTEFGMQSTPVPMTVRAYTDAANRQSVHSPMMRYHEQDGSDHGIGIIMHYTEADFGKAPQSFDDTLWLTQVNQAWAMRYGVEHWRRDMPKSMAATIWQYNDCWPDSTWSMVDYYHRVKAVLYQSKHFFAPILVSGLPDAETGDAGIYVTSDRPQDVSGELQWTVISLAGDVLRQGSKQIEIPARTSREAEALDLSDLVHTHGAANLLVFPEVLVEGLPVAANTLLFGPPKDLKLKQPKLTVQTSGGERVYFVLIETDVPALWVWANVTDTDASYSDNFIDLRPGRAAEIQITLDQPMSPFDFQGKLEVRSIYDIAPEMRG
ncbi:MAG: glycoside hydrolase family 2 protein [Acidobacteriaceae bacterium]